MPPSLWPRCATICEAPCTSTRLPPAAPENRKYSNYFVSLYLVYLTTHSNMVICYISIINWRKLESVLSFIYTYPDLWTLCIPPLPPAKPCTGWVVSWVAGVKPCTGWVVSWVAGVKPCTGWVVLWVAGVKPRELGSGHGPVEMPCRTPELLTQGMWEPLPSLDPWWPLGLLTEGLWEDLLTTQLFVCSDQRSKWGEGWNAQSSEVRI